MPSNEPGTCTVELRNVNSMLDALAVPETKNPKDQIATVNAIIAQLPRDRSSKDGLLKNQQWNITLVNRAKNYYTIRNVATQKYASAGESPEGGSHIEQSDTPKEWFFEAVKGQTNHYTITPSVGDGHNQIFWTQVDDTSDAVITLANYMAGKGEWKLVFVN